MPTFNGFQIITLPAAPVANGIEFDMDDMVGANTSPFTGAQQIQDWQNSLLSATVTLPPMARTLTRQWIAFFAALRGIKNVFQFGNPRWTAPAGSGAGTPLVNGAGQTGYTLATKDWTHSAAGVLLAGDPFQVGYRLHFLTADVDADASGNAILPIWPNLRESPADGDALTLNSPQGIWRLDSNTRKWSERPGLSMPSLQFGIREAL